MNNNNTTEIEFKRAERLKAFKLRQEALKRKAIYKQTPLKPLKRLKPRIGELYCERKETTKASNKVICYECRKTYIWPDFFSFRYSAELPKRECDCGSSNIIWIGPIARLPKKDASKIRWDEFWKHCGKRCAGACR